MLEAEFFSASFFVLLSGNTDDFFMNQKSITSIFIVLLLMLPLTALTAQEINKSDQDGKKQGRWIKNYPNGKVMYEGFFRNDYPEGEFRRYYEDGTMKSLLVFSNRGTEAKAILYYPNGLKASSGKYTNQLKEGLWLFYSFTVKDLLISEAEYKENKLNGLMINYYPDGKAAEKIRYRNNLKHGECLKYFPDGTVTLRTNYENGLVNGRFEAFHENGKPEMTGQYKNNLREGPWVIYRNDGSQKFSTIYTEGIPDNRSIDIYETEYIDSLERIKVNIADPEKTGEIW